LAWPLLVPSLFYNATIAGLRADALSISDDISAFDIGAFFSRSGRPLNGQTGFHVLLQSQPWRDWWHSRNMSNEPKANRARIGAIGDQI
jgi:hypothetical protein